MNEVYVYDWETFPNCATVTFTALADVNDTHAFVLYDDRNDIRELYAFINQPGLKLIGYNNIRFDYLITHVLLLRLLKYWLRMKGSAIAKMLYDKAQEVIAAQEDKFAKRRWMNPLIPQRDIFLINHFDNAAKRTSLKWVQCSIKWPSIEEMPFHHSHIVQEHEIPAILGYNLNDVLSTRDFYLKCKKKIEMRYSLGEKFGMNFMNDNDTKIGEKILMGRIAEAMNLPKSEIKDLRTHRSSIKLADCLLPYIKFTSPEFNETLRKFKTLDITKTKGEVEMSMLYDGMEYKFATGGLHAARKNKVLYNIDSCDVTSYYPKLGIVNRFHPEHLGESFCDSYQEIFIERGKYPKKTPENEGLKLALNGSYGKSNSQYSFLYDPKYTMQITLNGQLLLAMLCEWITERKAGKVLMVNTDGIEVDVYDQDLYKAICKEWMTMTGLDLEFAKYKVLAIRDVNNYFAITEEGKTKEKGAYEVDKEIHKDPSMRIVSLAVKEYFTKGTPIRQFIMEHQDMWDFFLYNRAKTGDMQFNFVEPTEGQLVTKDLPKTVRYFISKTGGVIITRTEKKKGKLHSGTYQTICNRVDDDYLEVVRENLNYNFYIQEANKLITNVSNLQTKTNISLDLFS